MITNVTQNTSYSLNFSLALQQTTLLPIEKSSEDKKKRPIQSFQFSVQEKSLPFVIGERVIRPLIDSSQSILSRIVKLAKSIDNSLSFPVVSAQPIFELAFPREIFPKAIFALDIPVVSAQPDEINDEIIKGIQQILSHEAPSSCTQSYNLVWNGATSHQSHSLVTEVPYHKKMSTNINELVNEARNAHLEIVVGQLLKEKGKHKLINKIFTDSEKDVLYNGPTVWREAPKSVVGSWDQGMANFCRRVIRWAVSQGYEAGGFPTFEAGPDVMGAIVYKKDATVWRDPPKNVVGDWNQGEVNFCRKVKRWAESQGFAGGLPTFEAGPDVVGVTLFKKGTVVWRDAPSSAVGTYASQSLHDFCRRVMRWAVSQGFAGGFPTFEEGIDGSGAHVVGVNLFPKS